jgi:hypothetical protein
LAKASASSVPLKGQVKDAVREYDKQMRNLVEAGSLASQEGRRPRCPGR